MTIRIGILGFAHGHIGVYCAQWQKMAADEVRLVAGWDHDPKRAAEATQKFSMANEATCASLLARSDVDVVAIGAETSMHADLVEQAAAAGKAIVLQKPLALTMQQADRIVASVERFKVPFTMAWQMRVDPQNLKIKQLIDEQQLGRVLMVRRRHGLATHTWPGFADSWHVQPELNRGMWADDACHAIDFLYWLLGMPVSVMAEIGTLVNPSVPDDNGVAIFRYARPMIAEVDCSFTCLAGENTTEVTCENGVIIQNFGDAVSCISLRAPGVASYGSDPSLSGNLETIPARMASHVPDPSLIDMIAMRAPGAAGLKWMKRGDKRWTDSGIASPDSHAARIAGLAPELLLFCRGERPPIATAHEGRDVLAMTLACYESSNQGQRVSL